MKHRTKTVEVCLDVSSAEVARLTRVLVARGCTAEVARRMPMSIWAMAAGKAHTRVPCAKVRHLVVDRLRALESTKE